MPTGLNFNFALVQSGQLPMPFIFIWEFKNTMKEFCVEEKMLIVNHWGAGLKEITQG